MNDKESVNWDISGQLPLHKLAELRGDLGRLGYAVSTGDQPVSPESDTIQPELPPIPLLDKGKFMEKYSANDTESSKIWSRLKINFLTDLLTENPDADITFEEPDFSILPTDRSYWLPRPYLPSGLRFYQSGGPNTPYDMLDTASLKEFIDKIDKAIAGKGKNRKNELMRAIAKGGIGKTTLERLRTLTEMFEPTD